MTSLPQSALHHFQSLDHCPLQTTMHVAFYISKSKAFTLFPSLFQKSPPFFLRKQKQGDLPDIYSMVPLSVSVAPLGDHRDMHVCKNSSLQMDSSHGLHQNTCMACCWKGKYRNPYSQQSQSEFSIAFAYRPGGLFKYAPFAADVILSIKYIHRNDVLHYVHTQQMCAWADSCIGKLMTQCTSLLPYGCINHVLGR